MLHGLHTDLGCISAIYFVSITQDEFLYTEDTTVYNAPHGMAKLKNYVSLPPFINIYRWSKVCIN